MAQVISPQIFHGCEMFFLGPMVCELPRSLSMIGLLNLASGLPQPPPSMSSGCLKTSVLLQLGPPPKPKPHPSYLATEYSVTES